MWKPSVRLLVCFSPLELAMNTFVNNVFRVPTDYYYYFLGCACGMRKFPSQGLNVSYSSDNASFLTHWATRCSSPPTFVCLFAIYMCYIVIFYQIAQKCNHTEKHPVELQSSNINFPCHSQSSGLLGLVTTGLGDGLSLNWIVSRKWEWQCSVVVKGSVDLGLTT